MAVDRQTMRTDDLRDMTFLGKVVDVNDPIFQGRCRVRVFGKFDELADDELPWADPHNAVFFGQNGGGCNVSIPRVGAVVHLSFDNGNLYTPLYSHVENLSADLVSELSSSYTNAHAIVYDGDEDLHIFYTQAKGLMINLKGSRVNITNDNSITIVNPDTTGINIAGGVITVVNKNGDKVVIGDSGIQIVAAQTVDIIAGKASISLDDSGINIDGGDCPVFLGGKNQVLYAKNAQATDITDLSEIGVSNGTFTK